MATNAALDAHASRLSYGARLTHPVWVLAFVVAVTDMITTYVGITYFGAYEANPIAAAAFADFGLFAMVPLKLAVIAIVILFAGIAHRRYDWLLPLTLVLIWGPATLWNLSLFALAL